MLTQTSIVSRNRDVIPTEICILDFLCMLPSYLHKGPILQDTESHRLPLKSVEVEELSNSHNEVPFEV